MPIRLDSRADDFAARFAAFLVTKREGAADVEAAVRAIIADVAARGDAALVAFTRKFDRVEVEASDLRVTPAEIDDAFASCDGAARDAL
jgi:histidinol dehydrogenase